MGTVVDRRAPPRDEAWSSADPATWTFAVSQVHKGRVLVRQQVVAEVSGASCGLELPDLRRPYLVFASADPGGGLELGGDQYYAAVHGDPPRGR